MSPHPYTEAGTTTSRLRLLVLSEVDDWDFGRQVKASGHEIVAWARPIWKRDPKGNGLGYTIRTVRQSDVVPIQTDTGDDTSIRCLEMAR